MKLSELLYAIEQIAKDKGLSIPYIVGGLPRDKLLNRAENINDIDITTGDAGIHSLSKEIAVRLGDQGEYKALSDGHSSIRIGDLKLDFSSNFKIPGINNILKNAGIKNITEMKKELYSRDFTCNTALMDMNISKIIDPTGLAVKDIKDKIIRTCLSPKITLGYDNRRIIRVVYMAAKLGFEVDNEIIQWVKDRPKLVSNARNEYLVKKINKSLDYNKEITISLFDKMGLWPYLPPTKELMPYMVKQRI